LLFYYCVFPFGFAFVLANQPTIRTEKYKNTEADAQPTARRRGFRGDMGVLRGLNNKKKSKMSKEEF